MTGEQFVASPKKVRGRARKTIDLLEASIRILEEIQPATVRAVCYRLWTAGLTPGMKKTYTNKVSRLLVQAREAGNVPWEWIVDEHRHAERAPTWTDPKALFDACARSYRRDRWADQPEWVEVWSEKGTVRGTLAPVLDAYGITFRVMRGYGSATVINDVAAMTRYAGRALTVLYVGDRDPSGMHMSEIDLPTRLARYGGAVQIIRVAIADGDTLPRAGVPWFLASDKVGDARHPWFVERYGERCCELDALSPVILRDRIEAKIVTRIAWDAWEHAGRIEEAERESVNRYVAGYAGTSVRAMRRRC